MLSNADLSSWSNDKLQNEWNKRRSSHLFNAGLIGFMVGVLFFGLLQKGWKLLIILLPLWLIYQFVQGSKKNKDVMHAIEQEQKRRGIKS